MLNNTKILWVWSYFRTTDWENINKIRSSNEKGNNIQQLTESIQNMSNKFDQFNITVENIQIEMKDSKCMPKSEDYIVKYLRLFTITRRS